MRIVFMGTPDFAVETLKTLVENKCNVVGVVTVPDKPAGRGQKVSESAVKKFAVEHHLPLLQPDKLKNEEFLATLKSWNADLQVVVAFRMLPEVVWNMPRFGTLNLHGSLLPHYRGAAPINWAIINGEKTTGVTTFFIEHQIDTGKIIFQEKTDILPTDTAETVHDRLMVIGANLVVKTVAAIEKGEYPQIPQNELIAENQTLSIAPKIFKEDCRINWNQDAEKVFNFIRGLSPYPAAWTELIKSEEKLSLKVFDCEPIREEHTLKSGTLVSDAKKVLKVAVQNGFISIKSLQLAGKKRLNVDEFLRGVKIEDWSIEIGN